MEFLKRVMLETHSVLSVYLKPTIPQCTNTARHTDPRPISRRLAEPLPSSSRQVHHHPLKVTVRHAAVIISVHLSENMYRALRKVYILWYMSLKAEF